MNLETAIKGLLVGTPAVADIVTVNGVYYGLVAQGQQLTAPYVRFDVISRVSPETFQNETGPLDARVQFDCYAAKSTDARTLAREVRRVLQGYQGNAPTLTGDVIYIQSALCEAGDAGRDGYDDAVNLYVCSVDIVFSVADT